MVLNEVHPVRARVRQSAVVRDENGLCTLTFHAMGTLCRVSVGVAPRPVTRAYLDCLLDWVADFEAKYSRFLDTSLVSRINAAAGRDWLEVDEETDRLLALCGSMVFFTNGAFDPTSLPLIRLWNWKANPPVIPGEAQIQKARELVGWSKVQRRERAVFLPRAGMCLDFGGIGKEYAVDAAIALAARHGVENVLVDFGQDIRVLGLPPGRPAWHIGLEDPRAPGTCWGSVAVTNHAVASSGDYLRCFIHLGRRYGHIIDPRTGYPVAHCLAASAIAPTCTLAGILTTSAFVLGPKEGFELLQRTFGASGVIVTETGNLITPRFHEHLVHQN
jgi:thiamine biosynthesis lipoprotein